MSVTEMDLHALHKHANDRKREIYWIGFLEGALSSGRIEHGEDDAILAEADKFVEFFDDPDASDLAEDIRARCFSGQNDMLNALENVVAYKRAEIIAFQAYDEKDDINEFLGFCAGIVCDGVILAREAQAMLDRFHRTDVLTSSVVFRDLWRALEAALADKVLTEDEAEGLREWIARLVGDGYIDTGLPNIGNVAKLDDPIANPSDVILAGKNFILTGPMLMGPRAYIISEIKRCGGTVAESVSRKTDFVVVSSNASKNWRTTHFGTKIEKAKHLITEGYQIRFVSETALAKAIRSAL